MQALLSRHPATRGGSHKQLLGLGVRDSGPAAGACQADNEHWESKNTTASNDFFRAWLIMSTPQYAYETVISTM